VIYGALYKLYDEKAKLIQYGNMFLPEMGKIFCVFGINQRWVTSQVTKIWYDSAMPDCIFFNTANSTYTIKIPGDY